MVIREMSKEECLRVLAGARLARLACTNENQPYIVPVYLAYDQAAECLYGFTTPGQKVEWMRANPLVCVEVDEVAALDRWVSVIVNGRYEELPQPGNDNASLRAPELRRQVSEAMSWSDDDRHHQVDREGHNDEREQAWQILKTHAMWWEPGSAASAARTGRDPAESYILIYYRIRIGRVTGHEMIRDAGDAIIHAVAAPPPGRWGWLRKTLASVFGGRSKEAGSAS